jgi:hypothetical protein
MRRTTLTQARAAAAGAFASWAAQTALTFTEHTGADTAAPSARAAPTERLSGDVK